VHPLINGLSDHDAQIITLSNIFISLPRHVFSFTRKINKYSISKFTSLLSYENWEDVFLETNVMWGHPHISASPSIHLSPTQSICLLASHAALFRAPTSGSH